MSRGGRRPNQTGRPKGSQNKRTQEIVAAARKQGITPLEVMLEAMHRFYAKDDLEKAGNFATRAAPYMHPRLNNVNVGGLPGQPIETCDVSLPELARRIAFIIGQAAREEKARLIEDAGDGAPSLSASAMADSHSASEHAGIFALTFRDVPARNM